MSEQLPIIPKAGELWVHTGNIVNWNRLKRKLTQAPTEELSECITSTVAGWLEKADRTALQYQTSLECFDEKFAEKLDKNERGELKVTVKVFLSMSCPNEVLEAVDKACSELGIEHLETLLVSLPESCRGLEDIQPVWRVLEGLVDSGRVFTIGVADLDKPRLEELHEWAQVKPCINQVNLESCCVMPADLMEYAKEKDIQLLTHSDPKEILSEKKVQELVSETMTSRDSEGWLPAWVARYSVLFKCRGIIKSKGYIAKACRDIKKRT